jgi:hypothetical protein
MAELHPRGSLNVTFLTSGCKDDSYLVHACCKGRGGGSVCFVMAPPLHAPAEKARSLPRLSTWVKLDGVRPQYYK